LIITGSSIGMESARSYTSVRMEARNLNTSGEINSFLSSLRNSENAVSEEENQEDKEVSKDATESLEEIRAKLNSIRANRLGSVSKSETDAITRIKTQCIQYLLQWLFGTKVSKDNSLSDYPSTYVSGSTSFSNGFTTVTETFANIHYFSETEETSFSTTGKVITADGREFDFNLSLSMSRSFTEYYEETYRNTYSLCDPLVINLDTSIASVSDQKFRFDLDGDGELDEISKLSSSSGYLALDLNNDGIINDGNELFGTKSGDGFKDLAKYDSDGNGWIDEADDIWKALKIYVQNDDGTEQLYSLSEKNVGAIYLGNLSTDFSIKDESNQTNAVIRKTGLFLYENGTAGTIQHLDLARTEYSA